MDFVNIFITFSGRINRAKYWIAAIVYAAISLVFNGAAYFADQSTAVSTINAIMSVVVMVSSIGVTVKRLHDRNKSGWYVLLFVIAPAILLGAGLVVGTMASGSGFV